ncbi:hypothetical protein [Vibrio navarrensis]|nr:hypothetical protein [Vibrio navarrensis]
MPINQVITLMTVQFSMKAEEFKKSIEEDRKNKTEKFSQLL